MDDWQTMVVNSLQRIERKLDNKVDNTYCKLMHSKAKSVSIWISMLVSVCTLIGMIYIASSYINETHIVNQDKVAQHGK